MALDTSAAVVRQAVEHLRQAQLEPHEFLYEVSLRVARVVPHDAAGWMTVDPDSLLPTGTVETSKTPEFVRAVWRSNGLEEGRNSLVDLARLRSPVSVASLLDPAVADASPRVQLLHDVGLGGDDLRAMLRSNGHTWGIAILYRETGSPPFSERERRFMSEISEEIGEGLRRSLTRRAAPDVGLLQPGVVVFGADGSITSATAEGNRVIGMMRGDGISTLYAVALRAMPRERSLARMRLPDGRWIQLQGGRLSDAPDRAARTAVTLVPASSADLTPLLLRLHGLTVRERQVAELLIAGWQTDAIATRLHISRHTLRDHVKSVFAKVGATSRFELMALL
ncbi:MAG TPA: LuxR C-terminal-related transcriptional regulator [Conexibacter sp.]|jgi:DNA-binding CsgD family transcriptional regulator